MQLSLKKKKKKREKRKKEKGGKEGRKEEKTTQVSPSVLKILADPESLFLELSIDNYF